MAESKGVIAIMGSGETSDSMVRVHRSLLDRLSAPVRAVFIDTPAGFQLNADDLFERAREYFQKRLGQSLERVSFKSSKDISPSEAEKTYQLLREADYIFVGPGSPTYALKNWAETPIPRILTERIRDGACFIAASAAALTLGRFTLPVYEIYKVGEDLHWRPGLDLLGAFSLNLVVIPHWNNAEGGTHDTRFCWMGEPRLLQLEAMLPAGLPILGIDEHTACILDFRDEQVRIRGLGGVTLRHREFQKTWEEGQDLTLEEFKRLMAPRGGEKSFEPAPAPKTPRAQESLMERIKPYREGFDKFLSEHRGTDLVDVLVGLEKWIWESSEEFDEEMISPAREQFRGMIAQLGLRLGQCPKDNTSLITPFVGLLVETREKLRSARQWQMADQIRDRLASAGVLIQDTPQGPKWSLKEES